MTLTNVSKLEKYADRLPDFTSSAMDWDWGAIVTVEGGNAAEVGRILVSKSCRLPRLSDHSKFSSSDRQAELPLPRHCSGRRISVLGAMAVGIIRGSSGPLAAAVGLVAIVLALSASIGPVAAAQPSQPPQVGPRIALSVDSDAAREAANVRVLGLVI